MAAEELKEMTALIFRQALSVYGAGVAKGDLENDDKTGEVLKSTAGGQKSDCASTHIRLHSKRPNRMTSASLDGFHRVLMHTNGGEPAWSETVLGGVAISGGGDILGLCEGSLQREKGFFASCASKETLKSAHPASSLRELPPVEAMDAPSTLAELLEEAKVNIDPLRHPFDRWITVATELLMRAKEYLSVGDLDNAFVMGQRYIRSVLEVMASHPQMKPNDEFYKHLCQEATDLLPKMDELTKAIETRHRNWVERKGAPEISSSPTLMPGMLNLSGLDGGPAPAWNPFLEPTKPATTSAFNPFADLLGGSPAPASNNNNGYPAPAQPNGYPTPAQTNSNGYASSVPATDPFAPVAQNPFMPLQVPVHTSLAFDLANMGRSQSAAPKVTTTPSGYNPFRDPTPSASEMSAPQSPASAHFNPFRDISVSRTASIPVSTPAAPTPSTNVQAWPTPVSNGASTPQYNGSPHYNGSPQPRPQALRSPAPPPPPTTAAPPPPPTTAVAAPGQRQPPGLRNFGNTCYMNSILQCLSMTMPLSSFFFNGYYAKYINALNPNGTRGVLTHEFARLVKEMWMDGQAVVVPRAFKDIVDRLSDQFRGYEQHDSSEFLTFLLDMIHEDLNNAPLANSASRMIGSMGSDADAMLPEGALQLKMWQRHLRQNYSIIVDLFQGQLESKLRCLTCGKTSTSFNPFMYLSIPIPANSESADITDCVKKFIEPEKLNGENRWFCPRCRTRRDAVKETYVVRFPAILIIHLKRFEYTGYYGEGTKIYTNVHYPISGLDIGYCYTGMPPKSMITQYNLFGVLNHSGTHSSGHYTTRMRRSGKWYHFDDAIVTPCERESLRSKDAYVLFYARHGTNVGSMTNTNWWQ
ncbi:ubiquitin-specific protease doa4 [Phlyctochytrium bullatum]|nr:ubiquitin-specific protease doa4 [Phlyctochytrium bullatum]